LEKSCSDERIGRLLDEFNESGDGVERLDKRPPASREMKPALAGSEEVFRR
jgi:hypothetical protein